MALLQHEPFSLADYYFEFLKNLDSRSKLDLISRLSQSIKETELIAETSLQSLFGAYPSEESADGIIKEIRSSRVFEGNTELL